MPQGREVVSSGTYDWARAEKLEWSYYDSMVIDATTPTLEYRLFQAAYGSTAAKTLARTNMRTAGIMPQNQKLTAYVLKVAYIGSAVRTSFQKILNLLNNSVLQVFISGKDAIYEKTLSEVFGIAMNVTEETGAANIVTNPFVNKFPGLDRLNKQIVLAANTPFEVKITLTAAPDASLNNDLIRVALSGLLLRAN